MSREDTQTDIEALCSVVSPLPLAVISAVLELPIDEVAAIADEASTSGRLTVERNGVSGGSTTVPQGRLTVLATRLFEELVHRNAPEAVQAQAALAAGDAAGAYRLFRSSLTNAPPSIRPRLIDGAVAAGIEASADPAELADLFVARARARRNRGEGEGAIADLSQAIPHLRGEDLVDALAFAAAIEDDLQHPADAERTVAMAMLVAAGGGHDAKLGSLSTFHGRVLSRLGFEREADDAFARGLELVARHGNQTQRFYAGLNQAWTDLDRGWVQRADNGFTTARESAEAIEDPVSVADKDIYVARARFGSGDPAGAIDALLRAADVAEETGATALPFLIAIAEAEGALAYQRIDEALGASARLRVIVERSFPAWVNRAATLEARAQLLAGNRVSARQVVSRGMEATPPGPNGLRVMTELEALELAAADRWDAARAADVADRLLQSGWLGTAAWFLTERCRREDDADLGRIAAALAHRIGNPMLAAEAVEAADAWGDEVSGAIALALKRVERSMPPEWRGDWRNIPSVARGLAVDTDRVVPVDTDLLAGLDEALAAAGLGDAQTVLSPSQRRAAGLVLAPSRVASIARWVLPVVAAVAAAVAAVFIFMPGEPEPQVIEIPVPSVVVPTTIPGIEDTFVEIPPTLAAQSSFAGGDGRNAAFDVMLGKPSGVYWRIPLTGIVRSDPIIRGKAVYVGTSEGYVSHIDLVNAGSPVFEDQVGAAIEASFASDQVSFDQDGQSRVFVVYGDAGATLRMRNVDDARGEAWSVPLGSPVTGPPLVRTDYVVAATTDGVLLKLRGDDAIELARYPTEGVVESGFAGPVAAQDGVIYITTGDGRVKLVDEATFEEICEVDLGSAQAVTHPVIAAGRWFVGTSTTAMFSFEAGGCSAGGGVPAFQIDVPIEFAPVYAGGLLWNAADELLLPIDIEDGQAPFVVSLEANITTPPVAAGDLIIVGVRRGGSGELVAVSQADGSAQWSFPLPGIPRTRPAVGDGVVVVAVDQSVIAIAAPGP